MDKENVVCVCVCMCVCVCIYVYIHTHTHKVVLLNHKKEWNKAVCSNVVGPRDYHTKWSKSDKDKSHDITYMWNLKKWYKWTYLQNRNRLTNIENKFIVTKGKRGGGIN